MASTSNAVIRLTADASHVAATARIIARHLTALADELDRAAEREHVAANEITGEGS